MAVPVPSISCCVFNNNDFFYQEPNELAFNWDTCCHLVICLQLIASHLNSAKNEVLCVSALAAQNDCKKNQNFFPQNQLELAAKIAIIVRNPEWVLCDVERLFPNAIWLNLRLTTLPMLF